MPPTRKGPRMSRIDRKLIALGVVATAASVALTSAAEARHHRRVVRVVAASGPVLMPAHERPGFVRATGPGLIDLGLGPVFPFGGWPK